MSLALKLAEDTLQLLCQRSVEELHSLFVAWFQGTQDREGLTTRLMECLAPDFSHVAPNGQFLQGRSILIGHLQDKYGCYKNRLFQIEIYDVRLLWHDEQGDKCLCTYEEWQSWLPDNAQQIDNNQDEINNDEKSSSQADTSEDEGVHQFGRLSTCLLERKPNTNLNNHDKSNYRWIHVHETWLEAETPQHERNFTEASGALTAADAASFMGDDTVATGPAEYHKNIHDRKLPGMLPKGHEDENAEDDDDEEVEDDNESSSEATGPPRGAALPSLEKQTPQQKPVHVPSPHVVAMDESSEGGEDDEFAGNDGDAVMMGNDDERHLLMLMSTQSLSRDQMARQDEARNALESSGIAFYEMDGANPEERENRNALFQLSGQWGRYPQFFLVDTAGSTTFWGDWDFFHASHKAGRLAQDIAQGGSESSEDDSDMEDAGREYSVAGPSAAAAAPVAASQPIPSKQHYKLEIPQKRPQQELSAPVSATTLPAEKQQMGGAASENVSLPPRSNAKLVLLVSTQTMSRDQTFRQQEVTRILEQHRIAYETLDGADKRKRERRNQLFRISTFWGKYPQFFHDDGTAAPTFWGTWDEFQLSLSRGTLVQDLKCVRPPDGQMPASNPSAATASETARAAPAAAPETTTAPNPRPPQAKQNSWIKRSQGVLQSFDPGKILFLVSTQSLSKDQMARQDMARRYLQQAKLEAPRLVELDGASKEYRPHRNELFKISKLWGRYPQIFVVVQNGSSENATPCENKIVFWGDFDNVEACHKKGNLRGKLFDALGLSDSDAAVAVNGAPFRTVSADAPSRDRTAPQKVLPDDRPGPSVKTSDHEFPDNGRPEAPVKTSNQEFPRNPQGIPEFERDKNDPSSNTQSLVVAQSKEIAKKNDTTADEETSLTQIVAAAKSPIPQDVSSKRHVSSKLLKYAKPLTWENSLVGLSLHGFDIGTSQGPIADETWYKEVTDALENVAQYSGLSSPGRKLTLPEMVFPTAHVALEGHGFWISWDVLDALEEWARAHSDIPIGSSKSRRGVSVLKTKDAKLWENNKRKLEAGGNNGPSVFHYDWSFSTPFAGKVEGGQWVALGESGMRIDLLTDTSVPILFFDDITLFEDDLHDNGQAQYNVKLRVMPSCAYVLARFWLRVDNVLVRVRETRLLVDFSGITPAVFRDVTWRECRWDSLNLHKLPSDVRSWHFDGQETQAWQNLIRKIPEVEPPAGIQKHAVLESSKFSRTAVNTMNTGPAEAPAPKHEFLEV